MKFYTLERAQSRDSCKASDWTTLNLAVKLLWPSFVHLSEGKILCKASVGSNHNLYYNAPFLRDFAYIQF